MIFFEIGRRSMFQFLLRINEKEKKTFVEMLLKKIFFYVNLKTLNTKISTNGNMNNMPNENFFLHIFPLYVQDIQDFLRYPVFQSCVLEIIKVKSIFYFKCILRPMIFQTRPHLSVFFENENDSTFQISRDQSFNITHLVTCKVLQTNNI